MSGCVFELCVFCLLSRDSCNERQVEVRRAQNSPSPFDLALEAGWGTPGHLKWGQTPLIAQQGPAPRSQQVPAQPQAGAAAKA